MSGRYVVRYGAMRQVGEFTARPPLEFARLAQVVVRSRRGTEWGEVLCPATDRTREYLGAPEPEGRILRDVNAEDERVRDDLYRQEQDAFRECGALIAERHMAMQLIDVELLFGREKILFYYLAETRVDFRYLNHMLATIFDQPGRRR